jgi:hypothetical protein
VGFARLDALINPGPHQIAFELRWSYDQRAHLVLASRPAPIRSFGDTEVIDARNAYQSLMANSP